MPRLFSDDFTSGISDEWTMMDGANFGMVNSALAAKGWFEASVGGTDWIDYAIDLDILEIGYSGYDKGLSIQIRRRDDTGYITLHFNDWNRSSIQWSATENGKETPIVSTDVVLENLRGH